MVIFSRLARRVVVIHHFWESHGVVVLLVINIRFAVDCPDRPANATG